MSHGYHHDTDKSQKDTSDVYKIYLLPEEDNARSDGEYRNCGDDHRAQGRGAGQLETICLTDEIDERLEECQKKELRKVLSLNPFDPCICRIEQEEYDTGHQYPDEYEIEDRNILGYKLICPYIGHTPQCDRKCRCDIDQNLARLNFR